MLYGLKDNRGDGNSKKDDCHTDHLFVTSFSDCLCVLQEIDGCTWLSGFHQNALFAKMREPLEGEMAAEAKSRAHDFAGYEAVFFYIGRNFSEHLAFFVLL